MGIAEATFAEWAGDCYIFMVDNRIIPVIISNKEYSMILVSAVFTLVSAYMAYWCFKRGMQWVGWFNLFASSINLAAVLVRILP